MLGFVGEHTFPKWINTNYLKSNSVLVRPVRMRRTDTGKKRRVAEVLLDAMMNNGLPSLLRYGDRNAMRFSIENRVPFLTIPLAEFLLSLPEHFLISEEGETKSIFRAAMRGIVPDQILDRRDKVGFESPMGSWVSEIIEKIKLTRSLEKDLEMVNFKKIKMFDSRFNIKESMRSQDWRLINLLFWTKFFVVKKNN
jgi:asparagine synthase (glutamine-hydrolysing)